MPSSQSSGLVRYPHTGPLPVGEAGASVIFEAIGKYLVVVSALHTSKEFNYGKHVSPRLPLVVPMLVFELLVNFRSDCRPLFFGAVKKHIPMFLMRLPILLVYFVNHFLHALLT